MTINRENLLGKIRALLSKTTVVGCTEAEALAALTKAQAMIDAYEVSDDELALTKEEKAILRSVETRDPLFIRRRLMFAIEELPIPRHGIGTFRAAITIARSVAFRRMSISQNG